MSIKATGLCVLSDNQDEAPRLLETVLLPESIVGMERTNAIVNRVVEVINAHKPTLIVMENYAMGADSNNLTRNASLGGVIQFYCYHYGYLMGWGTGSNDMEDMAAEKVSLHAEKLFVLQNIGAMKKYSLGKGDTKKDSRYLLTVSEKTGKIFVDDNQADAFMHARLGLDIMSVVRDCRSIADMPFYRQEVMISNLGKLTKGLSIERALKLPPDQKNALIRRSK